MGVAIQAAQVERSLQSAYDLASTEADTLLADLALGATRDAVEFLQRPLVPRTYLAVLTTMLVAKAMHGDELDVTLLQSGAGRRGYSASSVANVLAGFVKSRHIDLRSTSTAPFNNQPFTFKESLRDVVPSSRHTAAFNALVRAADTINAMSKQEAMRSLALTFVLARSTRSPSRLVDVRGDVRTFRAVCWDVARFVSSSSDGGRVGQAFCAALLDLTHPEVILGGVNDPDARLPGDVHAVEGDDPWLWCEVKQKVVVTGDVISFTRKVASSGGQRCLYLALANGPHPDRIDLQRVHETAASLGVDVIVVSTPLRAIGMLTQFAPGEPGALAARLLQRMRSRLVESRGSHLVLRLFDDLIERHGDLT